MKTTCLAASIVATLLVPPVTFAGEEVTHLLGIHEVDSRFPAPLTSSELDLVVGGQLDVLTAALGTLGGVTSVLGTFGGVTGALGGLGALGGVSVAGVGIPIP